MVAIINQAGTSRFGNTAIILNELHIFELAMQFFGISEIFSSCELPADPNSVRAMLTGVVAYLQVKKKIRLRAGDFLGSVFAAFESDNINVLFDSFARPIGFVTWGCVAPSESQRLINIGPSEFEKINPNSGNDTWITNLVVIPGFLPSVLRHLRDRTFRQSNEVTYFRPTSSGYVVKQLSRQDKTYFFQHKKLQAIQLHIRENELNLKQHESSSFLLSMLEVGRYLIAASNSSAHMSWSIDALFVWLSELISVRQIKCFDSPRGVPSGFICWAWLSDYTISRIGKVPLHEANTAEWNEGTSLCLYDAVTSPTVRNAMLAELAEEFFPSESSLLLYVPSTSFATAHFRIANGKTRAIECNHWLP